MHFVFMLVKRNLDSRGDERKCVVVATSLVHTRTAPQDYFSWIQTLNGPILLVKFETV